MKNTQELEQENNELTKEVEYEPEGDSYIEQLVNATIQSYQDSYNRANEKNEIKYTLTITTHKVATKQGNKDVAYLRLDRAIREKGFKEQEITVGTEKILDNGWKSLLVHQEAYPFRNMQERLNPNSPWKEQLYLNCLARIFGAGLEYAELLQRLKQEGKTKPKEEMTTEERLSSIGLVGAKAEPTPLTPADENYKEWLAAERAKEGL